MAPRVWDWTVKKFADKKKAEERWAEEEKYAWETFDGYTRMWFGCTESLGYGFRLQKLGTGQNDLAGCDIFQYGRPDLYFLFGLKLNF